MTLIEALKLQAKLGTLQNPLRKNRWYVRGYCLYSEKERPATLYDLLTSPVMIEK